MNLKRDKYVRSFSIKKPNFSSIMEGIRRGMGMGSEKIKNMSGWSLQGNPQMGKPTTSSNRTILDPQGPFLQRWNKIFVLSCVIAVALDPLFFYIPVIDAERLCLSLDAKLEITACVLRSFIDLFYAFYIILKFRTGFIAPSSRVFGRGELIEDPKAIAKQYLSSFFIIDVLSILPLPQVVVLVVIPRVDAPISLVTKELLKIVIFSQYIPRLLRIYPLFREVTSTSGILTETAWAGAALNLFLYMLSSHVIGAFWYLFAVERMDSCWRIACRANYCNSYDLYCEGESTRNTSFLNSACSLLEPEEVKSPAHFDFGIFLDFYKSHVTEHNYFLKKFFYCFWWGLRNLSSLGQDLKTSDFVGEILFAIFISIIGLVLFSLLIGNMQKYLQSITVRIEEMRLKRRDAEQWMSHRMLPENLRQRIKRYEQYKWQETRGVEEETLIRNLPKDLRRDIKRYLCWTLLKRVPMFEKMDEQLLDAMCSHLKPVLYTENSSIVREGDPVEEMLFIMRGTILTMTTNGGQAGFFNSAYLNAGDFCGEELLTWALDPKSSFIRPISTRTVQAVKDVEAFSLMADDLKNVASQFRRLHSKQLQHTFRFYSQQWKAWAACTIQRAWRRHCRRKIEKSLQQAEDMIQEEGGGNPPSFSGTIYASRFATNLLGSLRHDHPLNTKLILPPLPPQKPAEPNFSAHDHP